MEKCHMGGEGIGEPCQGWRDFPGLGCLDPMICHIPPTVPSVSSNCPCYSFLETWAEDQSCWPDNGHVHSCPHLPPLLQSLHSEPTVPCPKSLSLLTLFPHIEGMLFFPLYKVSLQQAVLSHSEGKYLVCHLHP